MTDMIETNKVTTTDTQTLPAKPAPKAPLQAGAKAAGIVPTSIEEVSRIAKVAIGAGLQVGGSKDNADEKLAKAMMIVLQGLELSVAPVQALNGIAIIGGRPAPFGKFARALVLRAGHRVDEWAEGTPYDDDFTHFCKVTRGDNGQVTERSFSVRDAKDAGLWDERAKVERWQKTVDNDAPWFRYRKDMLAARAFSRASIGVADALLGMEIAEVLRDVEQGRQEPEEDRGRVIAAPPPPLAARKPLEPEPDPVKRDPEPDMPAPAEEPVPEPETVDMTPRLADFEMRIGKLTTGAQLYEALHEFEERYDGHISAAHNIRLENIIHMRLRALGLDRP